jgi:hypothetical protein
MVFNLDLNIFYFLFFIYDRNYNLKSHTHIFWGSGDRTYALIKEWGFLERGIIIGPNVQVARPKYSSIPKIEINAILLLKNLFN